MYFLGALLLLAPGILASKPQPHLPAAPRTHNDLALRLRGPANATNEIEKRDTYAGAAMTSDACTGKNHKDSDWVRRPPLCSPSS
ncbi:hypothetical protein DFH06DRAFT_142845 [Mycena polygramma]|nr:hypothetical protein DFH06DRAFT_142845 [Mycena polygramma]